MRPFERILLPVWPSKITVDPSLRIFRLTYVILSAWVLLCLAEAWAQNGLDYQVSFELLGNGSGVTAWFHEGRLREALRTASDTVKLREQKAASVAVLRKRAERDIPQFENVLKSEGFFLPVITVGIDEGATPVLVVFRVEPGPPYKIGEVEIVDRDGERVGPVHESAIGLGRGELARAGAILKSQDLLVRWFRRRGYAFPEVMDRQVVVDHSAGAVNVRYTIMMGRLARFGTVTVEGLESINERIIRKKIPWKEGDRFDIDLLTKAQNRLAGTMLFGLIRITTADSLDEDGLLPITVTLTERKHRTISVGGWYRTEEGPGGKVSWEHRNFFGNAEKVTVSGTASGLARIGEVEFRKPQFLHPDQALVLNTRVADEEPDAYSSRSFQISAVLTRELTEKMTLGGGIGYKRATVEQAGEETEHSLVYFPIAFDWDISDDLFDPSRGGRLSTQTVPFFGIGDTDVRFLRNRITYSHYLRLLRSPRTILAGRLSLGSITGASRDEIPPDERFYAGGGGSIRGYEYQTVSPLEEDVPIGGRSLLEVSAEVRIRVAKKIDIIPFIDGGNTFEETLPDPGEDLLWGTGLGIQYMTGIGPIRLDIGVPIDRREDIDESYQVYLSLGHSF